MEEKKKMGRPTNNPKNKYVRIRLTEEENKILELCTKKLEKTKTEVIVLGLNKVYNEI